MTPVLARCVAYPTVGLVVLGLFGGCASAQPVANASPAPTAPAATCPASGVRLEPGVIDAAMGLRALGVDLVNCGREPYRVSGYPAVRALDEQRSALPVRVLNGVDGIAGPLPPWSGPPRPVVIEPGGRATAVVVWRNTYDDIRHPPVDAPYLAVAPTAGRPAQVLDPDGDLDLGSTGRLGVSPWRPAAAATPAPRRPSATPSAAESEDPAVPLL